MHSGVTPDSMAAASAGASATKTSSPATMADVARVAGVSRGTVSRYVRQTGYVSAEARALIDDAIGQVGYVPNAAARSLAGLPSRNIALIVHEDASTFSQDPNLMAIMVDANRVLVEQDHQLMVLMYSPAQGVERLKETLNSRFIDAVMVASIRIDDPVVEAVRASGLPAALLGGSPEMGLARVDVDNVSGAREVVEHLIYGEGARGAGTPVRELAMITGPEDVQASLDRRTGFESAAEAADLTPRFAHAGAWTYEAGARAMRQLLEAHPNVDAIFAANDALGVAALDVLAEAGRSVPAQVRVAGFDDSQWATKRELGLTTVRQSSSMLGQALAELVLRRLAGAASPTESIMLPTSLVVRGSTRRMERV